MTDTEDIVLKTKRLTLHRLRPGLESFLLELFGDPAFIRYVGDRGIKSERDAATWIRDVAQRHYESYGYGLYCLRSRENNRPIGICGLVCRDYLDFPDIGFALLEHWRGAGLASEAAAAVAAHAFETLKLPRLLAITQPDNAASIRLLEALGFRRDGTVTAPGETTELVVWRKDAV